MKQKKSKRLNSYEVRCSIYEYYQILAYSRKEAQEKVDAEDFEDPYKVITRSVVLLPGHDLE
ncbi:MAG TPA: hypothetical protein VMW50_08405 [Dehalococcoidia bacterium]|nr:hypothetical protein [Dehalococcoidia bacterium]